MLSILNTAKIENDQILVGTRNCGGLWKVNERAQDIFIHCEFLSDTSSSPHKIDSQLLTSQLIKNPFVKCDIKIIWESADIICDSETSKNLLEELIILYLHVRSHSYAKKIKETLKMKKKTAKNRSLRTEIKRASSSKDLGH